MLKWKKTLSISLHVHTVLALQIQWKFAFLAQQWYKFYLPYTTVNTNTSIFCWALTWGSHFIDIWSLIVVKQLKLCKVIHITYGTVMVVLQTELSACILHENYGSFKSICDLEHGQNDLCLAHDSYLEHSLMLRYVRYMEINVNI